MLDTALPEQSLRQSPRTDDGRAPVTKSGADIKPAARPSPVTSDENQTEHLKAMLRDALELADLQSADGCALKISEALDMLEQR